MTPDYGIIVARLQVPELHEGHRALFNAVGQLHPRVIVFIGCIPAGGAPTKNDPLDFDTRRRMVQQLYPSYEVYPIHNRKSDELWSADLDRLITERVPYGQATLYGSRDSFAKSYTGKRKVVELTLPVAKSISGTDLRNEIANVVQDSPAFRAGIIYGMLNAFDRVIPTVDIAIIHRGERKFNGIYMDEHNYKQSNSLSGLELLLAKRADEVGWRFPGGHAMGKNSKNHNYEGDANMESFEETASTPENLKYIGSTIIDDWRYYNTPESVKTVFFLGEVMSLSTTGGDDIATTKFFPIEKVNEDMFEPEHKVLFNMLMKYLKNEKYV